MVSMGTASTEYIAAVAMGTASTEYIAAVAMGTASTEWYIWIQPPQNTC